ncbi:MAG TPA: AEC family transporter [Paenalcaligenes sp.]|nr:AEC family transporter [Paenalcaligenes sp.]
MILTLVNIVAPVLIIVLLGFFFARRNQSAPNMDFINYVNIHVFCPALIFSALFTHPVDPANAWALILAGVLVIVLPGLLLLALRPSGIARRAYLVSGMFRNTGNVGIPLMLLAYGREQLGDIVLLFVLSNSLHFSLGLFVLSGDGNRWLWLRNPNIWMALLGITLAPHPQYVPAFAVTSLEMLGQITIPLMLFSLGVRLAHDRVSQIGFALRINLLYLVVGAICAPLILWLLPLTVEWQRMIVLSAMLPPAVLNFLLSEHYNASPQAVASIVLMGNVLSVAVIPLVIWFTLTYI